MTIYDTNRAPSPGAQRGHATQPPHSQTLSVAPLSNYLRLALAAVAWGRPAQGEAARAEREPACIERRA